MDRSSKPVVLQFNSITALHTGLPLGIQPLLMKIPSRLDSNLEPLPIYLAIISPSMLLRKIIKHKLVSLNQSIKHQLLSRRQPISLDG